MAESSQRRPRASRPIPRGFRQGQKTTATKIASNPVVARPNTSVAQRLHTQPIPRSRHVVSARSAPFGSGIPFAATKTAYPSPLRPLTLGLNAASSRRASARADDLTVGPVPASSILRARTPPGGHYYELHGVLYPVGIEFIDRNANTEREWQGQGSSSNLARRPLPKQLASKAARRTTSPIQDIQDSLDDDYDSTGNIAESSEEWDSDIDDKSREIIVISSDSESSRTSGDELLASRRRLASALHPLIRPDIWRLYGRTPFLPRTLRVGFRGFCVKLGVPTSPSTVPDLPFRVTYRFRMTEDDEWEDHVLADLQWICPLCDLHGTFSTREMLEYHVGHDHSEVHCVWEKSTDVASQRTRWSMLCQWTASHFWSTSDLDGDQHTHAGYGRSYSMSLDSSDGDSDEVREGGLDVRMDDELTIIATSLVSTEEMPRLKCEEKLDENIFAVPDINTNSPADMLVDTSQPANEPSSEERPPVPPSHPPPRTGITPDGKLIPPPQGARYGPAAEPPLQSCRPGGPRIYDLLDELPMEPFGVLAWSITQREEEIFENEDFDDEDKVMLALWNRWILLNKEAFVFGDRCEQMMVFIQEYHVMIHRAAGWRALRWFLMLFLANKFITVVQMSRIMKHYEKLVDMPNWYQDD